MCVCILRMLGACIRLPSLTGTKYVLLCTRDTVSSMSAGYPASAVLGLKETMPHIPESNNDNDNHYRSPRPGRRAYFETPFENKTQCAVRRSYVAKTTEQLEHALAAIHATGVELRAAEVVGEGSEGSAASEREVERVRSEVGTRTVSRNTVLS